MPPNRRCGRCEGVSTGLCPLAQDQSAILRCPRTCPARHPAKSEVSHRSVRCNSNRPCRMLVVHLSPAPQPPSLASFLLLGRAAASPQRLSRTKPTILSSFARPRAPSQSPNLSAARALSFSASSSRFFGAAFVSRDRRRREEARATSSIAATKLASLAFDGLLKPLIFLTN